MFNFFTRCLIFLFVNVFMILNYGLYESIFFFSISLSLELDSDVNGYWKYMTCFTTYIYIYKRERERECVYNKDTKKFNIFIQK